MDQQWVAVLETEWNRVVLIGPAQQRIAQRWTYPGAQTVEQAKHELEQVAQQRQLTIVAGPWRHGQV